MEQFTVAELKIIHDALAEYEPIVERSSSSAGRFLSRDVRRIRSKADAHIKEQEGAPTPTPAA